MEPRKLHKKRRKLSSSNKDISNAKEIVQPEPIKDISQIVLPVQQIPHSHAASKNPHVVLSSTVKGRIPRSLSSQVTRIIKARQSNFTKIISLPFSQHFGSDDQLSQPDSTGILNVEVGVGMETSHPTVTASSVSTAGQLQGHPPNLSLASLLGSIDVLAQYLLHIFARFAVTIELPATQRTHFSGWERNQEIGPFVKEKLIYHFEYNSAGDAQMLVIDQLPRAFETRYNFGSPPLRFLVRKCYEDLYVIGKRVMTRHIDQRPAVLFTGTPGIEKSIFLVYFVCRYLSEATRPEDRRFAFETKSEIYQYFRPTGVENEFECLEDVKYSRSFESVFPLRDVLVLSDIQTKSLPGSPRGKWKLLFNSPDPVRYKEYLKDKASYEFYLPTWTKQELQMFNPDESLWVDLYNVYGGVPRYVFPDHQVDNILYPEEGNDPFRIMNKALHAKGGLTAERFFTMASYSTIDSEMSYCLVHINPRPLDEQRFNYGGTVLSLASLYVFKQLIESDRERVRLTAKHFFNLPGNPASKIYGGATAGLYFEKLCLWLDPIVNTTITATSLKHKDKILSFSLPAMEVLEKGRKTSNNRLTGVLYQPDFDNLESGDAFCVIEKDGQRLLVVLQLTVSETHPVKMSGLKAIEKAFPKGLKYDAKVLLFVTPANGKLSSVQSIVTQNDTELQNTKASEEYEQYVYRYGSENHS